MGLRHKLRSGVRENSQAATQKEMAEQKRKKRREHAASRKKSGIKEIIEVSEELGLYESD